MCGRFTLTRLAELEETFGAALPEEIRARYNVAPSQPHPVLGLRDGVRTFRMMRWGLVPFWAKDPRIGSRLINARAERAAATPAFRAAFQSRRCLVPVDGFFEWARRDGEARRQPFWVHRKDGRPFALAGLFERWRDRKEDRTLLTFTVLTTAAADLMRGYHDRQPLIVEPEGFDAWLDPAGPPPPALLAPAALTAFDFDPVSLLVNDPRNDDPGCVAARRP